ncbi:type II toxin-antitoxin system MqsA family antitoxin [Methanospirillum sp.]|jgi:YgiT-type zinc finger domain-containing protein
MKCVICKHGELKPGITSVLFEKNGTTVVIKSVPVDMCDNCGEIYVSDSIAEKIMALVESVEKQGIIVDIRNFSAETPATC